MTLTRSDGNNGTITDTFIPGSSGNGICINQNGNVSDGACFGGFSSDPGQQSTSLVIWLSDPDSNDPWTSVTFYSSRTAFEFDNIMYTLADDPSPLITAVPEPGALGLVIAGMTTVAGLVRKRFA